MNNVNKIKIDNLGTSDGVICELSEELHELKDKLALTEKALELACNDLYWLCAFSGKFTKEEFISRKIDYFKTKAKEMKKSE